MFALRRDRAFTLVELLIVVVVLGILAGIVLPAFNSSTDETKYAATLQDLKAMRESLDRYKAQHDDAYPGYPVGGGTPTETLTRDQLALVTKTDGSTAAVGTSGYPRGPYLTTDVPANPYNGLRTIKIIPDASSFPSVADDTTGWIYQPRSGLFKVNSPFITTDGQPVFDL